MAAILVFAIYFAIIFIVWLVVLVPLYMLIPLSSILWRWPICTGCGALAGAAIMVAVDVVILRTPLNNLIVTAAVVGGTTCLFGSLTRDYFHRNNNNDRNA